MDTLEIILDKVCDELTEYGAKLKKGDKMSAGDLEVVGKLIDIKKNIMKTWKLEDEDGGYSQAGEWEAEGRMGGTYDRGNSYANRGQHYVRGHYSRSRGGRGYSRNGGDEMMEHIEKMMEEAETPKEREIIKRFKMELERA